MQELHGFGIFGGNSFRMNNILFIGFLLFFGYSYTQTTGTITDSRDGKIYKTVVIGNQTWMAENLNVDRFRNGDLIPEAKSNEEWDEMMKKMFHILEYNRNHLLKYNHKYVSNMYMKNLNKIINGESLDLL